MSGWVKIHREVIEHPLFRGNAAWLGAWVILISEACWKPTRFDVKGRTITLERGQVCISTRALAKLFGWSKSATSRFLMRLKTETMIGTDGGTSRNIITIYNYEKYQSDDSSGGTAAGTAAGTTSGQHRDTKEEGKKGRRESSRDPEPDPPQPSPFEKWWSVYPRKEAKKAAEKAFAAAMKKATLEVLIQGARNYAESIRAKGTEARFIAHAATWLNQERWNDWQGQGQVQDDEAPAGYVRIGGTLVKDRRPPQGPERH